MIPDIHIPVEKQPDVVLAALIRQEALLMVVAERVNSLAAIAEKRNLQDVQDDFDAEYLKKLKDLARKLNEIYSVPG
jgi:hypothetical protein